jgi:hypothetical protein
MATLRLTTTMLGGGSPFPLVKCRQQIRALTLVTCSKSMKEGNLPYACVTSWWPGGPGFVRDFGRFSLLYLLLGSGTKKTQPRAKKVLPREIHFGHPKSGRCDPRRHAPKPQMTSLTKQGSRRRRPGPSCERSFAGSGTTGTGRPHPK